MVVPLIFHLGRSVTDDLINTALPDAQHNKDLYWQMKRSLDSTYYRNIELEVWKNTQAGKSLAYTRPFWFPGGFPWHNGITEFDYWKQISSHFSGAKRRRSGSAVAERKSNISCKTPGDKVNNIWSFAYLIVERNR